MSDLLPFLAAGLTAGAVYGLAGIGLVLTYKTSGVFNFAHGALATVAAYLFYALHVQNEVPWAAAAAVSVLVAGPIMGLLFELLARSIQSASLAVQVASTVGVLLAVASGVQLIFPMTEVRYVEVFLPTGGFAIGETQVQWSDVVTFIFALMVTVVLAVFFRRSLRGVQMRAVVDDPHLLAIFGTSPTTTRRWAWVMGTVLVAASGVLFAPLLPLNPFTLTLLIVAAFGAAAIGAFSSLPITFAGGLVIGVLAALAQKWFISGPLAGLPASLPFVVLFVVLLVFPKRYLAGKPFVAQRTRATWSAPASVQLGGGIVLLVGLALVPSFAGIHLTDWTLMVAGSIVFLSLSLLAKTSGQVSLCHISFTAIGAAGFSHLAVDQGVPWLLALLLAGLVAVPVGAVLAIPAIRLTGLYLALATFGFGLALQYMFYQEDYMFGSTGAGLPQPRPDFLGGLDVTSDKGYYYLVLAFATLAAVVVIGLTRSRLGRLLRGIADSPLAVETNGANANVTRVLVFCLSAFLAAVGGALAAVAQTTSSGSSYNPITSLLYFVLIVVIVGNEPWNALIASAAMALGPSYLAGETISIWLQFVFGLSAVVISTVPARFQGVPPSVSTWVDSRFRRRRSTSEDARAVPTGQVAQHRVRDGVLNLRGISVSYGGLLAVDDIDIEARTGRITGLIGPNGAGKTTTFNAASGLLRPTKGAVLVDGVDVTRRPASARARIGLGRTFQKMELLESLTVADNVALGAEAALSGLDPLTHVLAKPGSRRRVREATWQAMRLCEIDDLAGLSVSTLSTGQRRLVELARCLAGEFRIILMDEPSSGLDHQETGRLGAILTSVVADRGVGILLVEHDMSLVLDVCDSIYVLDFGQMIFEGTPDELVSSPIVQAAYLGDVEVEQDIDPIPDGVNA